MLKHIKRLLKRNSFTVALFITLLIAFLSLSKLGTQQPISFKFLDKIEHFIAYTVLSFCWLCYGYLKKTRKILILVFCVLYGVFIEVLQGATGYRTFDYMDMLANSFGVLIGYVSFLFLVMNKKTVK